MLLGSKKDKDTDARVRSANGITETRGGRTEGPEQQVQGWWELYPKGSRKLAPDGGEPRAGGPTSASPRV